MDNIDAIKASSKPVSSEFNYVYSEDANKAFVKISKETLRQLLKKVDPTLTLEGEAADAKATGEKFSQLQETIKEFVVKKEPINLFNGTPWDVRGFFYEATFAESSGYYTTIPILLDIGSYLFITRISNYGTSNYCNVVKCTEDGTPITFITGVDTGGMFDENRSIVQITITEKGYYRFNAGSGASDFSEFMLVKGSTADDFPTSYISYVEPYIMLGDKVADKFNPLTGKKLGVTGDSICYGAVHEGGYAKIVAENNSMTLHNIAISGATIVKTDGRFCISESVDSIDSDCDYAILEGGVNDASLGLTLGTISDGLNATLDTTTFYGAFENMLKKLILRFKGKKIGYIAVHQMTAKYTATGDEATDYYYASKKCCKKWGVPFLDLNISVPPFGMITDSNTEMMSLKQEYTFNGDGWHPTEECYRKYYVPKIEAWLKTL